MTRFPPLPAILVPHPEILARLFELYHGWRKRRRDRADLAAMSAIELQDIGGAGDREN